MKKIIIILLYTQFLTSCVDSPKSKSQVVSSDDIEINVQLDSVILTPYEYKIRGNYKADAGDKHGALEDYTRAIMVDPLYDTAYYNRGITFSEIGDKEAAIKDYTKVIQLNKRHSQAYYSRGNAKCNLGDGKEALVDYTKAIELKPDYIEAYINRSILKYENNDPEGALLGCKLAIKHCAPDADLYNNYGRFLYDLKRFKESAEAYGDGIKYFPEDYKLYYGRGLARNQSGDKKGACEDWRKSSALGCFEANALLPLCDECETYKKQ